jgi:hypothetical protein
MSGSLWQRIKVTVEAMLDATTLYDLMFDPGFAPGMPQLPAGLERLPLASTAMAGLTLSASQAPVESPRRTS